MLYFLFLCLLLVGRLATSSGSLSIYHRPQCPRWFLSLKGRRGEDMLNGIEMTDSYERTHRCTEMPMCRKNQGEGARKRRRGPREIAERRRQTEETIRLWSCIGTCFFFLCYFSFGEHHQHRQTKERKKDTHIYNIAVGQDKRDGEGGKEFSHSHSPERVEKINSKQK